MPSRGAAALASVADEVFVRLRDGARLATDVYLPRPLKTRVPAILIRACYDKSGDIVAAGETAAQVNARGYALVVQDVRGTFGSGGERTPWLHEASDGFDVIDWIVRQSWCDEQVAMLGDSYLAFTQWAAVSSAHPGLRAVAPRVGSERVPDAWFAADVASPIGADWLGRWWSAAGMLDIGTIDWLSRPVLDALPAELVNARELHREFLSLNEAELHAAIYPAALPAGRITVPALHAGAWFDVMTPYQMRDWSIVSSRSPAAGDQYLVMAAEDHTGNPFTPDGRQGDAVSARSQRLDRVLDFFDRYVQGRPADSAVPRLRYEVAGAGWRTAERWPPAEVQELQLFLGGVADRSGDDAGLLTQRPDRPHETSWLHDPSRPVPSLVDVDNDLLARPQPDERDLHRREDVLAFTADVATTPLDIVGPVAVDVVVSSTAPSMHLVATLLDVDPDGRATSVTEGITRIETRYGSTSATVHLAPTAYRLATGHRLRLALASSRYPRYLVHPGTDHNLWTAVDARPSRQTLAVGGSSGTRLRLGTVAS